MSGQRIGEDETAIRGAWIMAEGRVVSDDNVKRIEQLTTEHLTHVATDSSGWEWLFIDSSDGRLWERTYPLGFLQAGGPPSLLYISAAKAKQKYNYPA